MNNIVIRRFIYFIINTSSAIILLYFINIIIALIFFLFHQKIGPIKMSPLNPGEGTYLILFPTIVAFLDSKFANGFLGSIATGIRVQSDIKPHLSFIGNLLRTVLFWSIPLFLVFLFNVWFHFEHFRDLYNVDFTSMTSTISLSCLLYLPFTILFGRGFQGLHDYLYGISYTKGNYESRDHFNMRKVVIKALLASVIVAIIVGNIVEKSDLSKNIKFELSKMEPQADHFLRLARTHVQERDKADALLQVLTSQLSHSPLGHYVNRVDILSMEPNHPLVNISLSYGGLEKALIQGIFIETARSLFSNDENIQGFDLELSQRCGFDFIDIEKAYIIRNAMRIGLANVIVSERFATDQHLFIPGRARITMEDLIY